MKKSTVNLFTNTVANKEEIIMSKSTVYASTTIENTNQEVITMKKAIYDEKTAKAVFDAIKNGADMSEIAEKFNVKAQRTVKSWLDRYYTKKKAIARTIYAQLLENNKSKAHKVADETPHIPATHPVVEDTPSNVTDIAEGTKPTVNVSVESGYPDILIELEIALMANRDMNKKLVDEEEENPLIIDVCSILFQTTESPESAIKTFIHILQSTCALSKANIFCWHKEIMAFKYYTDSQLMKRVANLVLDYGWFFEKDQWINYQEYRMISYRAYKSFKEIINPLHVANIATEESLFSEFNHYECFPVNKKKSGWIGSENNIKRAFCKLKGINESEGQLTISPRPYKDHFFVKEEETVTFTWETASAIEIWKYEFHNGKFFDVGHRKGGAKSLLVNIA